MAVSFLMFWPAEAAVRLVRHLPPEAYHPDWVHDLGARAREVGRPIR